MLGFNISVSIIYGSELITLSGIHVRYQLAIFLRGVISGDKMAHYKCSTGSDILRHRSLIVSTHEAHVHDRQTMAQTEMKYALRHEIGVERNADIGRGYKNGAAPSEGGQLSRIIAHSLDISGGKSRLASSLR